MERVSGLYEGLSARGKETGGKQGGMSVDRGAGFSKTCGGNRYGSRNHKHVTNNTFSKFNYFSEIQGEEPGHVGVLATF